MKITNLSPHKNYILVELDSKDKYKISEDALFEERYKIGLELSEDEITKLKKYEAVHLAYLRVLNRIAYKDRTKMEIVDFLYEEYELSYQEVNQIIERLQRLGYLDDERYIIDYIELSEDKVIGFNKMKDDLIKVKIPSELIDKHLHFDFERELRIAKKYIEGNFDKPRHKSHEQKKQMVINRLQYRGFSFQVIKEALSQVDLIKDEDQEREVFEKEFLKCERRFSRKYSGYELRQRVFNALATKGYEFNMINSRLDKMELEKNEEIY